MVLNLLHSIVGLLLGNLMTVVHCCFFFTHFVALPSELPRFLANNLMLLQNSLTHMHFRQHWFCLNSTETFYIRLRIWVMPNGLQDQDH